MPTGSRESVPSPFTPPVTLQCGRRPTSCRIRAPIVKLSSSLGNTTSTGLPPSPCSIGFPVRDVWCCRIAVTCLGYRVLVHSVTSSVASSVAESQARRSPGVPHGVCGSIRRLTNRYRLRSLRSLRGTLLAMRAASVPLNVIRSCSTRREACCQVGLRASVRGRDGRIPSAIGVPNV